MRSSLVLQSIITNNILLVALLLADLRAAIR